MNERLEDMKEALVEYMELYGMGDISDVAEKLWDDNYYGLVCSVDADTEEQATEAMNELSSAWDDIVNKACEQYEEEHIINDDEWGY